MNRCPHCGYNLKAEEPIYDGPWSYSIGGGVAYDGTRLDTAQPVHEVLGAIMQAKGRVVAYDVLTDLLGSNTSDPSSLVKVYLYHARKALARIGKHLPTKLVYGVGVKWERVAP